MSFRSIDEAEGHLYDVVSMMTYMIRQARDKNKPTDFSCLKLKKVDLESLQGLLDTCETFIKEYRYLEDNSHDY